MNLVKDLEAMIFYQQRYNHILCCYGSTLDYFFNNRNARLLDEIKNFIKNIQTEYSDNLIEQMIKYIFGDEDTELNINHYKKQHVDQIDKLRTQYARKNII